MKRLPKPCLPPRLCKGRRRRKMIDFVRGSFIAFVAVSSCTVYSKERAYSHSAGKTSSQLLDPDTLALPKCVRQVNKTPFQLWHLPSAGAHLALCEPPCRHRSSNMMHILQQSTLHGQMQMFVSCMHTISRDRTSIGLVLMYHC